MKNCGDCKWWRGWRNASQSGAGDCLIQVDQSKLPLWLHGSNRYAYELWENCPTHEPKEGEEVVRKGEDQVCFDKK